MANFPCNMRIRGAFILPVYFLTLLASVQSLEDTSLYNPGIQLIRQATTENDYLKAAGYFENLTTPARKPQWLQHYYTGLCYIQASYKAGQDKDKDDLLDKAQFSISHAGKLNPEEPEVWVLQAFLYQSRIQVNPEMRGMSYSMKADANLKKATSADDSNPRAWSLMGYNVFHTPELFGGGAKKALPLFLKAREKYKIFKPLLPFMPQWGEPENERMISECLRNVK